MDAQTWADGVRRRLVARGALLEALGEAPSPLDPPLTEAEVAAFEAAHGVALPEDYRAFVTRVGASAPGPEYGLSRLSYEPFTAMPSVTSTLTTTSGETFSAGTGARAPIGRASRLDRPFSLDGHWVPVGPDGEPQTPPVPADANLYDGVLRLAEIGCGYFFFLVVTGPRRGEVGVDYTAGAGSIGPVGQTFRAWYDGWLDGELRYAVDASIQPAIGAGTWTVDPALVEHLALFEAPGADPQAEAWRLAARARARWYVGDREAALEGLEELRGCEAAGGLVGQLEAVFYADALARATSAADPGELAELVEHPGLEVRVRLAANAHLGGASLARLARDASSQVLRGVAAHANTPAEALEGLVVAAGAALGDGAVAGAVARDLVSLLDLVARRDDLAGGARAALDGLASGSGPWASVVARSLVHRADATAAELEEAAGHAAPWVRHAVAVHGSAPPELVGRLGRDGHWAVRMGAAGNPACPPEVLAALAGDGWPPAGEPEGVLSAVASNPSTPEEALWALAYALGADHSYALCRNPALPEGVMLAMVLLDRSNVLGLWERPGLPDAVREALLGHYGDYIRRESAQRSTGEDPPFVGARQWWDLPADARVADVLAVNAGDRHPSYPRVLLDDALARAEAAGRPTDAMSLVSSPWADEALLGELAGHSYSYTRAAVARHPRATEAMLVALAGDPDGMVRGAAASDPRTPLEVVAGLVEDGHKDARAGVAKNPRAERAWLERLIGDEERWVRRDAALNPRATPDLVARLSGEEPPVLAQLAMAPGIGADLLATLAAHEDPRVHHAARWRLAGDTFRAARAV